VREREDALRGLRLKLDVEVMLAVVFVMAIMVVPFVLKKTLASGSFCTR
jgi:hypothetical protein